MLVSLFKQEIKILFKGLGILVIDPYPYSKKQKFNFHARLKCFHHMIFVQLTHFVPSMYFKSILVSLRTLQSRAKQMVYLCWLWLTKYWKLEVFSQSFLTK